MGLIKHLLFWPVTGPSFLARFSVGKVDEVVRGELTDDAPIKEALLELQLQLESGEVDDDEYVEQEGALMQQLREVRSWREEFGMGVSGGPVRLAESEREAEPELEASVDEDSEPRVYGGPGEKASAEVSVDFDDE